MVKIICDSSCDLSKELIEKYNLTVIPFKVMLGEKEYRDGIDLTPDMIFEHVEKTNMLPKTAAINEFEYSEIFEREKCKDGIICFTISSKISVTYNNAVAAAKNFDNVFIIDSLSLSTGLGIQAIYASILASKGLPAEEIVKKVEARRNNVQISFQTYKLNYLHKGGRCSSVQLLGANLLKIRPSIILKDGKMGMDKKYMGKMEKVCVKYVDDIFAEYNTPNKFLGIVTHASATPEILNIVKTQTEKNFQFDNLEVTCAGATVTSHCGENTIGVIYYNDNLSWD